MTEAPKQRKGRGVMLYAIKRRSDGRFFRTWKHKGERWVPSFGPEKFRLVNSEEFAAEIVEEISEFTGQPADCEVVPVSIGATPLDTLLAMLKPLVWEECDPVFRLSDRYYAFTVFGKYAINPVGDEFEWRHGSTRTGCKSVDHGKQLAWLDYQSRVRALFEE